MSLIPPASPQPTGAAAPAPPVAHNLRTTSSSTPLRWVARVAVGLTTVFVSLLLIAWLAIYAMILPHIEEWREPIEARATRALGVTVRIGHIALRSSGWVPSIELADVVLLDAQQRPALRLPRVFAAVSPRSLLSWQLRFEQLLIDGAELEVRRDATGRILVAGLVFDGAQAGDGRAADWFFAQHEFVIRGGALRWVDELRGAAPLALRDVQFAVRNGLRLHELRLDATPPLEWGDRFSISGRFTQPLLARHGDWERWSGPAYASLPRADLQLLRQHVALPFDLREGVGALRGWFELKDGQPVAATVDLALRAVALRLAPDVDLLDVDEIEGRFTAQRDAEGAQIALQRFTFLTGDGIRWPQGDLRLAWRQRAGQPATGGSFSAQRLDVGQMAQIASRIPLGGALQRLLAELNPRGTVVGLDTQWTGPLDAPTHYRAKGALANLALAARPSDAAGGVGRPGLRGATMQFDATEAGGQARVVMNGGELHLPGVFEAPVVPLDQLSAQLLWKIEAAVAAPPAKPAATAPVRAPAPAPKAAATPPAEPPQAPPPQLSVQVKDMRFSNADASAELNATWHTGAGPSSAHGGRFPGRLELEGKLSNGTAARTFRYLPQGLPKDARRYVESAVLGGKLASATYRVKGDLWDFPFNSARSAKDGEFRITAKLDNVGFAFVPSLPAPAAPSPWPVLTGATAELVLDRNTLEIRNGNAQMAGLGVRGLQLAIRNLDTDSVLSLDATARGPLAEMLRVVATTPIGGWTGKALDAATATGNAGLTLNLGLPLNRMNTATARGSLQLAGNDVRISPDTPLLAGAKARIDFTQKGFNVVGATARVFGGDASFEGSQQADGMVRFNGQGTASAEGLRRAPELGLLARLAGSMSGQTGYRINAALVRGQPEFTLTSTLTGLAINLPAPLNKPADVAWPLRVQTSLDAAGAANGAAVRDVVRDTVRVELGSVLQAQWQRELGGDAPRVLRGGIGVLEPAPQPLSGVAAHINLRALDLDAWEAAADKLFGGADKPAGVGDKPAGSGSATSPYEPDTIALRVQELSTGTRKLTHLVAGVSQDAGMWRANLDADQLNGYVEYRPPSRRGPTASAAGRVYARLARLSLPKSDADQVESLLDQQPANVPALDIVVEDFELRGRKLGRVEIEAVNRATPLGSGPSREVVREWQLAKFNLTMPEAQLAASGHWAVVGPAANGRPAVRRSVMDFKLTLADSGALLERLGTRGAIRGGKGDMSGTVAWLGSPFALDYPSLAGQINVNIEAGQFLKADPGAARLLGVLSLQSLPRRLSLDFRDLFQQGFAFDSITGDVKVSQGVAQTNNLRMRGVQAAVLMEGSADIARETQDLRVVVVPEINAGTAALAYAVINPAIGLGAFLAQALLKKPLTEAGTREFHVSGPWADPKVEPVQRKLFGAVPAAADAAGSSPAPASAPAAKP